MWIRCCQIVCMSCNQPAMISEFDRHEFNSFRLLELDKWVRFIFDQFQLWIFKSNRYYIWKESFIIYFLIIIKLKAYHLMRRLFLLHTLAGQTVVALFLDKFLLDSCFPCLPINFQMHPTTGQLHWNRSRVQIPIDSIVSNIACTLCFDDQYHWNIVCPKSNPNMNVQYLQ